MKIMIKKSHKAVSQGLNDLANRVWWLGSVDHRQVITVTDVSKPFDWLAYDWQAKSLTAQFANGSRYRYEGVPRATARALVTAHSPGKFFNKSIRNDFPAWKLV